MPGHIYHPLAQEQMLCHLIMAGNCQWSCQTRERPGSVSFWLMSTESSVRCAGSPARDQPHSQFRAGVRGNLRLCKHLEMGTFNRAFLVPCLHCWSNLLFSLPLQMFYKCTIMVSNISPSSGFKQKLALRNKICFKGIAEAG